MTLFIGTGLEAGLRRALGAGTLAAPRTIRSPELLGPGRIGDAVEVDPGDWADAAILSFAWLRNGVPIPGATEAIYAPSASDDRFLLACRVTAENEAGRTVVYTNNTKVFSIPVPGAILRIRYTQLTGSRIVNESPFFPDGSLSFQVTGEGVSIDPATGLVTMQAASLLSGVSVLVTALNSGGRAQLDFQLELNPVATSTAPALVDAPALEGTGLVGDELVVQPGVWEGEPAPELALQWLCDGAPIADATRPAFTPGDMQDGADVACRITARNAAGETVAETRTVEIVRTAPVAVGVLADVVMGQGGAAQTLQAASAFAGDALRFSVAGAGATIDPETGVATLPTDALRDAETVTVTAENSGGAASCGFAVTVLAAPAAVGAPAPVVLAERAGSAPIALAAHFSGSDLVYALEGAPSAASIDASSGVVTLATDKALTARFTVRATNAAGSASQSVAATVLAAPAAVGASAPSCWRKARASAPIAMAAHFSGSDLVYALEGAPSAASIDASSGVVTLATDKALTARFAVRATNAAGSASQSVAATVLAAPAAVGAPAPVVLAQGAGSAPIAMAAHFSGSDLVYALEGAPSAASIDASSGVVTLATDKALTARFAVRATNAAGSASQSVAATVLAAPAAVGAPAPVVLAQGAGSAPIAMAAHFSGSDLVYALEGAPSAASIDASSGVVTLATDKALTARFAVRATNAAGSASQSVAATVLGAIVVVGSKNTAGPATSIAGLVEDDDVFVVVRRTDSASAALAPTGNPRDYKIVATATGTNSAARMFHAKVTAAMLTGGVFTTGSFANAGTSKTYIVAMRNVASITEGAATGGLRTARPFSAVSGLSASAHVVGFATIGVGAAPVPADASILQDSNGRLWRAGPTATWAPKPGPAGNNVDFLEIAVGLNAAARMLAAPIALAAAGAIVFATGPGTRTVPAASFFAGQELAYELEGAPAGVTIDAASGTVTIPTAAALETTFAVRATNSGGSAIRSFALTILAAPAPGRRACACRFRARVGYGDDLVAGVLRRRGPGLLARRGAGRRDDQFEFRARVGEYRRGFQGNDRGACDERGRIGDAKTRRHDRRGIDLRKQTRRAAGRRMDPRSDYGAEMKYYTITLRLDGALAKAVAVEWTNRPASSEGDPSWEPCLRLADGAWKFSSRKPFGAAPPHECVPGAFGDLAIRYRLNAAGPWSEASASRKEIVIVEAVEEPQKSDPLPVAPVFVVAPVLAGLGKIGSEVTATSGLWSGYPAPRISFQWRRAGANIPDAVSRAYVPGAADDLTEIDCVVTAKNAAGETVATTNALAVTYFAPVVAGDLPDEVFDEDTGPQLVETDFAFLGENLAFAASDGVIDARTGVLTVSTDQPISGRTVTVTAANSGGKASVPVMITVEAAPPVTLPAPAPFASGEFVVVRSDPRPKGQTKTFSPIVHFPKLTNAERAALQVQFRATPLVDGDAPWHPVLPLDGEAPYFFLPDAFNSATPTFNEALWVNDSRLVNRLRFRHRFSDNQAWSTATSTIDVPLPAAEEGPVDLRCGRTPTRNFSASPTSG